MGQFGAKAASLLAMAALATTSPVQAADSLSGAEKIRRLDIMLMVTGLRCRSGPDNFTAEYGRFTTNHMVELNQAAAQLKAKYANLGPKGAARALDHLGITIANTYGQGHPWLSCAELKTATASLAQVKGRATLEEAADQILAGSRGAEMAMARRRR